MGNYIYECERNINRAIDRARNSLIKVIQKEVNNGVTELEKEATKMYDKYIDDYYEYRTKSYYRHEVGKGTGTGINLYRGQNIGFDTDNVEGFDVYNLSLDFNGNDMAGDKYQNDSKEQVLELVMHGIRGIPTNGHWWATWSGSYEGKYFSFTGTMYDAFEQFSAYSPQIIVDIAKPIVDTNAKEIASNLKGVIKNNIIRMFQGG